MMKLLKISLVISACLTLLTASSQAALVLEFREVGGTQVELTFAGSVSLTGSFDADTASVRPESNQLNFNGLDTLRSDIGVVRSNQDFYLGERLFFSGVVRSPVVAVGNAFLGFVVVDSTVIVSSDLDSRVEFNNTGDVDVLDAGLGGNLNGKTLTFNTTFATSRLDRFLGNGPQDLWRVAGTTGDNNLIQFRVNASSVPEPSSILMSGLGLLSLLTRRKRKA